MVEYLVRSCNDPSTYFLLDNEKLADIMEAKEATETKGGAYGGMLERIIASMLVF